MSRYRMNPTHEQDLAMREHCSHARFVWNLAVEQQSWWTPRRGAAPNYNEQARQLAQARQEYEWLRAGSSVVQQQALKDFAQAMRNFFARTHRKPIWRKRGQGEGFRIVNVAPGDVRRLSRNVGEVKMPKVGWVRFRWSRAVADGVKSYRVTLDRSGRWHVAFAAIPEPIEGPGTGEAVGVDRGVNVSAALSTGELSSVQGLSAGEAHRLRLLQRKLSRCVRGSNRRAALKLAIAKLKAREVDRRKDWAEKLSTELATNFDAIHVEDLKIANMSKSAKGTVEQPGRNVRQKAGLNRGILANGWGLLVQRLEHKAPGRVVRVPAPYTSQTCNACKHRAPENRESQAVFRCVACGHQDNADVNAAKNIRDHIPGHGMSARAPSDGDSAVLVREPQAVA